MLPGKTSPLVEQIHRDGRAALHPRLSDGMVSALGHIFESTGPQANSANSLMAANDNADEPVAAVLSFLRAVPAFQDAVRDILGPQAVAVRMQFLGSDGSARQAGHWHQSTAIAAKNANPPPPGFGPVDIRLGVSHVTAPQEFLANLLTASIHLDAADESTGVMEISPGSHRRGRVSPNVLAMMADVEPAELWTAAAGDVHLYRPLLLHRFLPPAGDRHCRTIKIEMAPSPDLPGRLEWHSILPIG